MKRNIIGMCLVILLSGCKTLERPAPTPFETGAEVAPPRGCIEGRERGVDC